MGAHQRGAWRARVIRRRTASQHTRHSSRRIASRDRSRARAHVRARVRPASTRGPSSTSFAQSRARSRGILRVHRGVVRARSTRRDALAIVDDARRFTLRAFTRVRGLERALARRRTATSIGRPFDRQRLGRSRRGRSPRTEGTLLKFD